MLPISIGTGLIEAQQLLQWATSRAPDASRAFSLLSIATTLFVHMGWANRQDAVPSALEAAQRAMSLNPDDAWAHAALGYATIWQRPDIRYVSASGEHGKLSIGSETATPKLGEKLLTAFSLRRKLLIESGTLGVQIIGPSLCAETNLLREFLYKNFVPYTWYDPAGRRTPEEIADRFADDFLRGVEVPS